MDVKEIMVQDVITVKADTTVKEAVKIMNKNEIGCLVVENDGKVVGIMTERDLLRRIIEESRDPEEVKVSEIMSKPLIVGATHMDVEDVVRLMFMWKIKKLPILEDGRLIGLITLTDIARTAGMGSLLGKIIKELKESGWLPPKRMKKIVNYYIA